MRSLTSESDFVFLKERIASVLPADAASWGRMNAYQMMRHLTEAMLVPLGEKQVSETKRLFDRTILKWGALWYPRPWPKGVHTRPELDLCCLGIFEGDFEAARRDALDCLARLRAAHLKGARHPFFGALTQVEWMRWGWLHNDHHLRQFGR